MHWTNETHVSIDMNIIEIRTETWNGKKKKKKNKGG